MIYNRINDKGLNDSNLNLYKIKVLRYKSDYNDNLKKNNNQVKSKEESKIFEKTNKNNYMQIIKESSIICCTLNKSGDDYIQNYSNDFDYLIVDEAAQALEISVLIPLLLNIKRVIMVGDHFQLPSVVFSEYSKLSKYNISLFERLINSNINYFKLEIQYRMSEKISEFISDTFYNSKLITDKDLIKKYNECVLYKVFKKQCSLCFFNITTSKEEIDINSKSFFNADEFEFCAYFVKSITKQILDKININKNKMKNLINYDISSKLENYNIAVICAYKAQINEIKKRIFSENQYSDNSCKIKVDTIDSFQGAEEDIVIISTVRGNYDQFNNLKIKSENINQIDEDDNSYSNNLVSDIKDENYIGFLKDYKRLNVAISRARYFCFVIGNELILQTDEKWKKLIDYCKKNKTLFDVKNMENKSKAINNIYIK